MLLVGGGGGLCCERVALFSEWGGVIDLMY